MPKNCFIIFILDETIPDVQGLTETELTTLLANHLFGKLATTANYVIDAKCTGKKSNQCLCGKDGCMLTGRYGDTSVGKVCFIYILLKAWDFYEVK